MIRFIYGCSGSGKSSRIYELMREDAKSATPSYLIVPEQETVQCETRLLDILPPSSQLSSQVLNFSRLANLVFRTYGGLSYNYADKGSKTLIMWKSLKELSPLLLEYSKSVENNGASFAKDMLSAITELKAYCVSPSKLENAAKKLEDNTLLKNKLLDLSLISSLYQNTLSEKYSDVSDDLSKLAEALKEHDFFRGANIYIDSFSSFTAQEYSVIKEMFRSASNVTVTLTLDSLATTQIHYESTANTALSLISIANSLSLETVEEKLSKAHFKAPAINEIASSLWMTSVHGLNIDTKDSLRIIKCLDPYEEADAVAGIIHRLLTQGFRCRDIAVIARDASGYRGILDTAFEKAGIPYFFSSNSEIMSKPPIKFLLSALRIKIYNWRAEDVISYLKTGICDVDERDIDLLECYLSIWNIRGSAFIGEDWAMNPDGYSEFLSARGKEILKRVNLCKNSFVPSLIRLFTALDAAENASEMCHALYLFIEEHEMAKKLSDLAKVQYNSGKRRDAAELLQLYNSTVKALENISASLGEDKLSCKEFFDALRLMLDTVSIGAIPTAKDQVTIGSASMLRISDIRCVILIGVNEGEFPQIVKESGFFNDNDKKSLASLGITLSESTAVASSNELFYLYRAMSAPNEKLILLYHSYDLSGDATPASMGIGRIKKLFSDVTEEEYASILFSEKLVSKEAIFEKLSIFQNTPEGKALSVYFNNNEQYRSRANTGDIPKRNIECRLAKETSDALFGNSLKLTQSIIDRYVGCPFEYMCDYLLSLKYISPVSFDYSHFGTYIHYIFESFVKKATKDGIIGLAPNVDYINQTIDEAADEYFFKFFRDVESFSPRLQSRFERMRRLAKLVAMNISKEFSQSHFEPKFFELSIGGRSSREASISPLKLPFENGKEVSLIGKVDRVDILHKGNDIFVRVVDYKSGSKTFSSSDIEKGHNVQLPLYLFALCDEDRVDFRRALGASAHTAIRPAGAMYLSSLINPVEIFDSEYDRDKVITAAENSIQRSGFLINDEDILREMSFDLIPQYICGAKLLKNGSVKGSALVTNEAMADLKEKLNNAVLKVATDIFNGNMDACPSISNNAYRCENCKMSAVCRSKRNS